MAGGQERILRRRIKSVESTKKITKAMELISASRILKAQARVAAARPYSEQVTQVIKNLASAGAGLDQPLLVARPEVNNVGYIVIAADRGLAGGYNGAIIRAVEQSIIAGRRAGQGYKLFLVGKKARNYFKFKGYDIEATFSGFSDSPSYEDARAVAAAAVAAYEDGTVDRVDLAYTQFLSLANQRVDHRQFLPMQTEGLDAASEAGPQADYEFEPDPTSILNDLVPRYVEARLFAALLDAAASEHAARQRAMKSATDNADELIKVLSRNMNRARQDAITSELIEIASGAEALAQAASGVVDLLRDHIEPADYHGHHYAYSTDRREHQDR